MLKVQTLVIEYDGEKPPFTSFGEKVNGMQIVAMSMRNELENATNLEEKLDALKRKINAYEYENGIKFELSNAE